MAKSETEFAAFLRQHRVDSKLTQEELRKELSVSSGYISKLESGAIREPDESFLSKLAERTGVSVAALREKCRLPVQTSQLRMACGHSVWNAPLFIAASEGLVPNLQISSFMKGTPTDNVTADQLEWIVPFSDRDPDQPRSPLSAADVAFLLQRGDVDVGSLPGNLVRTSRLQPILLSVGTVVDSASGCSLVCTKDASLPAKATMSTKAFAEWLTKHSASSASQPSRICIGAEEGTIAIEYVAQACAHTEKSDTKLDRRQLVWNCKSAELGKRSFEELQTKCSAEHKELIGIVAWEPHATWLTHRSRGGQLGKYPLHFAPEDDSQRVAHLTYEIAIPKRRLSDPQDRKRELFQTLTQLMTAVAEAASRLNKIDEEPKSVIRRLAAFYGFLGDGAQEADAAMAETQDMIGRVLYSVRWHIVPEMSIGPQV